jgi:hypothetical protein
VAVAEQEMSPVQVRAPSMVLGRQQGLPGQPLLRTARDGVGGRRPVERGPRWVQAGVRDQALLVSKEAIHVMSQCRGVAAQHPRGME